MERHLEVETMLLFAAESVGISDAIAQRAYDLNRLGYGPYDALHLASAESANADVLLSTDDGFVKRAVRKLGNPKIEVSNPVSWTKKQIP